MSKGAVNALEMRTLTKIDNAKPSFIYFFVQNVEIDPKTIRVANEVSKLPFNKRKCSECDCDKNQHLMINCDACKRWLHIGCLDPPLTHMPRKSKYSVW